ncbi:MAG: 30S ribosomal protein S20 [Patescibacteria group bacterium]|jgi:small subunit ribosomal protein S20
MPNKKSAAKALRQSAKRALRNYKVKHAIKDLVKDSQKMIAAKEKQAAEKVRAAIKVIDKAAGKKIIAKNAAARKKSRLMKKLNSLMK